MMSPRPLDRFSLVKTSNPEETRVALTRIYASPRLEILSRHRTLRAVVNHCQLQHIGLSYGSYGAKIRMQFPETGLAAQIFSIRGKSEAAIGGASVTVSPDRSVVISPREALSVTNDAEYERLVLTVSSAALRDKLAAIIGDTCADLLKFNPVQNYALPVANALRNEFLFLVDRISTSAAPLPGFVLAEFEQLLMSTFLLANRHNYSHLLERATPDTAPSQVRRAEEYIQANWQQAITLENLAAVTGVSAFSLFRSFRKSRGYSPMQFATRLRLSHARELLQRPQPATTVAEVAATCGFCDLVRFANDYMQAFSEQPWQTLSRGKGIGPARH